MSNYNVNKSDEEWKSSLDDKSYNVLRKKGTEYPHTGKYNLHFEEGIYQCRGCGEPLFGSEHKFNSGCGWPSFSDALEGKILYEEDRSHGMLRTEILCANCGGHLGHVFNDGPAPTHERYCVNSASLDFTDIKRS